MLAILASKLAHPLQAELLRLQLVATYYNKRKHKHG